MLIDKETIVSHLREQGDNQNADQAEQELPPQVDHEQDAGLLQKFGIDPMALVAKFSGGGIPGM